MHAHAMHICQVLHLVGHDAGECPRRHHRVGNVGVLDSSDAGDSDSEQEEACGEVDGRQPALFEQVDLG